MAGHKWSPSQRRKYKRTMLMRKETVKKSPRVEHRSHFYRLKGAELIPVRVRKIVAWVIE